MSEPFVKSKKEIERSSSYPSIDLSTSIEKGRMLKSALGKGPFNRESAAQAMGYKGVTGTSGRTISALVQYGLLTRVGNIYSISALFERIIFPLSEEDKEVAIKTAAYTPKLYSNLLNKYNGSAIPSLLNNILIHDHGINPSVSREVAESFKKTMEFAGLLVNGVLSHDDTLTSSVGLVPNSEFHAETGSFPKPVPKKDNEQGLFEIKLPSGIRIYFPNEMSFSVATGKFLEVIQNIETIASHLNIEGGSASDKN